MKRMIGVMGPSGHLTSKQRADAYAVGALIAKRDLVLVTGGMSGVMEQASKGAKEAGGLVVGICPAGEKQVINDYVDIPIMTSMGGGRNYMNILSSDVIVAIGCNQSAGTLSEIAFALQSAVPIMIVNPPPDMRQFLSSFRAPGRAQFGDSAQDVDPFLTQALEIVERREQRAKAAVPLFR